MLQTVICRAVRRVYMYLFALGSFYGGLIFLNFSESVAICSSPQFFLNKTFIGIQLSLACIQIRYRYSIFFKGWLNFHSVRHPELKPFGVTSSKNCSMSFHTMNVWRKPLHSVVATPQNSFNLRGQNSYSSPEGRKVKSTLTLNDLRGTQQEIS